jgi:hypothetical protein
MANDGDKNELAEFYEDAGRRNLLLQTKNPLAWYNAARRSMLQANMIRSRIEEDISAENEGKTQSVPLIFKPSRSGDIFWLKTLRAAIRNDIAGDHFIGNDVDIQAEETIDKRSIEMMLVPQYRKLHHLYPAYLYLIGAAIEDLLKAIYIMRHTDSIYSKSDPEIVEEVARWGHKLNPLATNGLQLELLEAEERLLRMLQQFIEWAGKYPGPKSPERYAEFVRGKNHPNPFSVAEHANYSKDEISIHDLYKRLVKILDNEAKERLKKLSD